MDNTQNLTADKLGQLESANRLKAEFVANVSHELRTPVHAIIGYAELLLDSVYGPLSEEQQQTVQYIHDSASDLLSLVNNLLDLAKIESGRSDLILTTFDLRDLISETFGQLKSLADAKHLGLESKVLADHTVVRTDRGKLKQILVNLLSNSLKFTDSGKITVSVAAAEHHHTQAYRSHNQQLCLRVQDTGVGIPAEKLDKIFEKFYQVDGSPSRSHDGTGLGLYITKQLLELLAATINVESTIGEGTTVAVTLPVDYDQVDAIRRLRKRIAAARAQAGEENVSSDRIVLAVSENPDIGRILTDGLSTDEFTIRVAPATSEVLTLAKKLKPLVILLNAEDSSPEFWCVFQELKALPETKSIPTIFLGNSSGRALGAPLTVAAPLNRQEVLKSIRAHVSTGKKNVLVVDDEESLREILKCALADEGYQVSEAADGKEAIEKLDALKPDLVLLDLHIPEIDGWGVIRYMTQKPELKDAEVLVISGDMPDEKEAAALEAHTSGFICKSNFKVNTVLEKVATVLEVK